MDNKTQKMKPLTPDFRLIYSDIISKLYPEKKIDCIKLLSKKELSIMDILELNHMIFGKSGEINQKYRSYDKSDILKILDFQKKHKLNNTQLAKHFTLSRNSVARWKKAFLI